MDHLLWKRRLDNTDATSYSDEILSSYTHTILRSMIESDERL